MPLYRYVKAPPVTLSIRRAPKVVSLLFMTLGFAMLTWAIWPIVAFSTMGEQVLLQPVSPIKNTVSNLTGQSLPPVVLAANLSEQSGSSPTVDFTNANTWYPAAPQKHISPGVDTYTLSIPTLKIKDAIVIVGGDDLNAGLVHYGGTGIPGLYGTTVVFGHSMLPQFYSPTNYKSIFSLLPTLKIGDVIDITYDGVQYMYTIFDMVVVDPTDLSVLEQRFDDSYLTLVTCVPPGTYWKRLNVKAKLTSL